VEMKVLIEVNVAREESKFGFMVEELENAIYEIAKLPNIKIIGLMTIAPYVENPEENRCHFKKMFELYVDINRKNIDNVHMTVLSMGMTNDYEVAVCEGATMVRVGTGIFGDR
ncbi:MAG: alanine racemase, partial [Lachnospiraceae bacterium]